MRYKIESVIIETPCGGHIEQQKIDACFAALEHNCIVRFEHNGREYNVKPGDLCKQVNDGY